MKGKFAIRPMSSSDVPECVEIGEESSLSFWSYDGFLQELDRPDSIAFVAGSETRLSGFIIGRIIGASDESRHEAEIYNLGVRPDSRRLGLGGSLFDAFLSEAANANVYSVWLEVRASNSAAIAFYRAVGFVQISVRKGFYSNPSEDAILMNLKL